jgi:hypothetical protein
MNRTPFWGFVMAVLLALAAPSTRGISQTPPTRDAAVDAADAGPPPPLPRPLAPPPEVLKAAAELRKTLEAAKKAREAPKSTPGA